MRIPASNLAAALALAVAACSDGQEAANGAPEVSVATLDDLPTPLPYPYADEIDPAATNAAIDAAFAQAQESGKRVILDLGGNWCGWCRGLAGVMKLPEVAPFIEDNFELVYVNVSSTSGQTDQNLQVLERFGTEAVTGYPWLIVVEPGGTVLHSSYEVTDENHETPQAMVNWLAQWAAPAT